MKKYKQDETITEMLDEMIEYRVIEQYATLDSIFKKWTDSSYMFANDVMAFRGEIIQGLYDANMLTAAQISEIDTIDSRLLAGKYPGDEDIQDFLTWLKEHRIY